MSSVYSVRHMRDDTLPLELVEALASSSFRSSQLPSFPDLQAWIDCMSVFAKSQHLFAWGEQVAERLCAFVQILS